MIEVLADPQAIAADWAALWRRAGAPPFQSPAWLLPWWRQFGTGRARVAVLRGPAGLDGVLPLYELPDEGKLLPMGAGLTDLQDALLAPGAPPGSAAWLLAAALAGVAVPCHLCDLPPGAALRLAATPRGWHARQRDGDPCPVLALPAELPRGQRRKLRMARHRAERAGGWWFGESPEALDAVLGLHAGRWSDGGVLADARVGAFLHEAVPALAEAGAARVFVLRLDGQVAAGCVTLTAHRRFLVYLQGYDRERSHESPGTLLLGALLERAAAEGVREVNLLRGAEGYKYAWGAEDRVNALRVLTPA